MPRERGNVFLQVVSLSWDVNGPDHLQQVVQKLLVLRVVSQDRVSGYGDTFYLAALAVVEDLRLLSQEEGDFEDEIGFIDREGLVLFVVLVVVKGLVAELRRGRVVTAAFFPEGELFVC